MQIGYLLANFTRLFGAATSPSPSNHGPDDDIILNNHNKYLNDWIQVGFILTQIYMFGYVKTFIMAIELP